MSSPAIAVACLLAGIACSPGHAAVVAPEPPRDRLETRLLAHDVRVLATRGEPMYVVDGGFWIWRDGHWLLWNDIGWRRARPPLALATLSTWRETP